MLSIWKVAWISSVMACNPKGLIACRSRKKLLHAVGGNPSQIGQIEQFITGKIRLTAKTERSSDGVAL